MAVNTKKEIAESEKAANAAHKRPTPQLSKTRDIEAELLESKRKIQQLEKRLASSTAGGPAFIIESPILHDQVEWAKLNDGKNSKHLRAFMLPSYLQIHGQPMVDPDNGRTKHIKGGSVELIKGRGTFESEDWARYLSLNYPDYVITKRQADGSYKRFVCTVPKQNVVAQTQEEFYYDELPQTARTIAAANPYVTVQQVATPTLMVAPTSAQAAQAAARPQAQMPQALKDRLAAIEEGTPEAVLTGV